MSETDSLLTNIRKNVAGGTSWLLRQMHLRDSAISNMEVLLQTMSETGEVEVADEIMLEETTTLQQEWKKAMQNFVDSLGHKVTVEEMSKYADQFIQAYQKHTQRQVSEAEKNWITLTIVHLLFTK